MDVGRILGGFWMDSIEFLGSPREILGILGHPKDYVEGRRGCKSM